MLLDKRRGRPILYVLLKKALYGTLQAAVLVWKNLTTKLTIMEFSINPFDSCVSNKTITNKQYNILWLVDDINISHMDSKVVD